jgi:hypothetical protein
MNGSMDYNGNKGALYEYHNRWIYIHDQFMDNYHGGLRVVDHKDGEVKTKISLDRLSDGVILPDAIFARRNFYQTE